MHRERRSNDDWESGMRSAERVVSLNESEAVGGKSAFCAQTKANRSCHHAKHH